MKRLVRILGGLAAAIVLAVAALAVVLVISAVRPAHPVGVAEVLAPDPGHAPIRVTLYYPASAKPRLVWMGTGFVQLAADAPLARTGVPLVILSHGTGAGPASHVDTALALAQAGYMVAAPMHNGDNYQDDSEVGTADWIVDRARQVARVSDFMLTRWTGHARLDTARVGIFGFSAGATTALVAIGGAPDFARVAPQCAAHPEFVCTLLKPGAPVRVPSASEWTHTPAIKAAVIVAPGFGFTFEGGGLSAVTDPVQLWDGTADTTVPLATNTGAVRRLLPTPPEFHLVPGAAHLSFLTPCGATAVLLPPMLCADPPGFDRRAFHARFNADVVAFFDRTLPRR